MGLRVNGVRCGGNDAAAFARFEQALTTPALQGAF
jgi:hypothetical protein